MRPRPTPRHLVINRLSRVPRAGAIQSIAAIVTPTAPLLLGKASGQNATRQGSQAGARVALRAPEIRGWMQCRIPRARRATEKSGHLPGRPRAGDCGGVDGSTGLLMDPL